MEKVNRWIFYILGMVVLAAGITLAVSPSHAVSLFGITLICAGFSVGFGVAQTAGQVTD